LIVDSSFFDLFVMNKKLLSYESLLSYWWLLVVISGYFCNYLAPL